MTRLSRCFIAILFALLSCGIDEELFDPDGGRYLPLQVGNSWRLVPGHSFSTTTIEMTVTDEVVLHGKTYFKIHQYVVSPPEPVLDRYVYFRIDENNFVYVLSNPGDPASVREENFLRLGAPDNYMWVTEGTEVQVTLLPEVINGHTFNDCKSFFYNDPSYWDDENSVTLAPGIGYLRMDGGFGRQSRLSVAVINGVEYRFDQ